MKLIARRCLICDNWYGLHVPGRTHCPVCSAIPVCYGRAGQFRHVSSESNREIVRGIRRINPIIKFD